MPRMQEAVGRLAACQKGQRLRVKLGHQRGGFLLLDGFGVGRPGGGNGQSLSVRVGVRQRPFQPRAAKDDHKAVSFARPDDDLRVVQFLDLARKQGAQVLGDFGGHAPGAAVGDDAAGVEGAEIGARGDVARLEFQAQAQGLNDAAPDLILNGIVAEQSEVARPAAGGDAGSDGDHAALRAEFGQGVKIGGRGRLQRREKTLFFGRQIAQTVQDYEGQFGVCFDCQF